MSSGRHFDFDVIVIGGGSAGFAATRIVAAAGMKTAVLEGGPDVGGLCILRGCMPTKALLQSADILHQVRQAGQFGIEVSGIRPDLTRIMARKNRLITEFAGYRRHQLENGPFEFIRANAQFLDQHTLLLDSGKKVTGRSFLIATGSIVAPPPLTQLSAIDCMTSDGALLLEKLPDSLIVLGGGAVAVEFSQFFARLGVRVTLIQRSQHILREMDSDAAAVVESVLRKEGITLLTNTRLLDAWQENGMKGVTFESDGQIQRVAAQEIFFGLGRVPHTAALRLEAAGVGLKQGRIVTNPEMQTNVRHIYAAGDCTGLYEIVHLAVQQGEVAGHNLVSPDRPKRMDYRLLTTVVFSSPQIASVGLTEKAAHGLGLSFLSASYPFSDHGKSMILEETEGFVRLLADPESGLILGGGVVGPLGGELIHEIVAAMAKFMTVHELAAMPHYHPTLAEIWTYPAEELASKIPLTA